MDHRWTRRHNAFDTNAPSETVSKIPNPDGDLVFAFGFTFSSAYDALVQQAEKAKLVSQDGRLRPRARQVDEDGLYCFAVAL